VGPGRLSKITLAAALVTIAASPAAAASGSGTVGVRILSPLTVSYDGPLQFGTILASAVAGTVTVDAQTEARTMTGGVTAAGGTVTAARFSGWTEGRTHVKIDVPTGSVTLTRAGGGATMTADSFDANVPKNNWQPPNDIFDFRVGARLNVGANQLPGVYSGQFNVTVVYR
jgi:hypothetical protein